MKNTAQIIEAINELNVYALESEMETENFIKEMIALMNLFQKKIDYIKKMHIM